MVNLQASGKYIRHLLAALVGALVAAIAGYVSLRFGLELGEERLTGFTDFLVNLILPVVLVWWYSWAEKFLKRFPALDPEGFTDRATTKAQAPAVVVAHEREG